MDASQASSLGTTGGSGGNGLVNNQTNDAVNATPNDDPKQNLNQVINSIQKTLGLLHQLYLTVSSFNAASQLPLLQRLLIDDGKNPDEFTRDVLNDCIAKNQVTKGKTDAFKSLRKHLLEELEQTFPDEVESYREIRASAAAESKRLAQSQSILQNGDVKVKTEL
ncbi:mediator of RNA polymerase II transcription subunit 10b-like isoform X2 [Hibiscus syriacus]|uniref:mediator of RNA polymerase II transcription subunit 10b-like isoform X2 n=1 Tax=Hibiscus syriacus TaxID=106335 RepID=UPI0019228E30|nr:mediator of RNA polymerase II transcription subunit 10b-like isoform X2 [Hibiscus syriacus]